MTRMYRSFAIATTALLLCATTPAEVQADRGAESSGPVSLFGSAPAVVSDAPAASLQQASRRTAPAAAGPLDRREQMVRRTQEALTQLGYDPGVADGKLGSLTRAAISRFQQDRGRPATGNLDHRLLGELAAALTEARTAGHRSAAADSRSEVVEAPLQASGSAAETSAGAAPAPAQEAAVQEAAAQEAAAQEAAAQEAADSSRVSLIKPAAAAVEPTAVPAGQAPLAGPTDYSFGDALSEAWLITRNLSGYLLGSAGRQLAGVVE